LNSFRRATVGNLNRLAHKAIVGLIKPSVHTARSERSRQSRTFARLCAMRTRKASPPSLHPCQWDVKIEIEQSGRTNDE
jgi:hypothetical protein